MIKTLFIFIFFCANNFLGSFSLSPTKPFVKYSISTIYGDLNVDEIIIDAILNSFAMKRMENVHQGLNSHFNCGPGFMRSDHCIGVCKIVQMYGGTIEEQIAALCHDLSHTAFSHISDFLFNKKEYLENKGHQDEIHLSFLESTDIGLIIKQNQLSIEMFDPENIEYRRLEQPFPDMCADRIEYNLRTAYSCNMLSLDEIGTILKSLKFENKKWFFDNALIAVKFAEFSLYFTENLWANPYNFALHKLFTEVLKYAIEKEYINYDLIAYGTDIEVMEKLKKSGDQHIYHLMANCFNIHKICKIVNEKEFVKMNYYKEKVKYSWYGYTKFRAIDPLVMINGELKRLTEIDEKFKTKYNSCRLSCETGFGIILNLI